MKMTGKLVSKGLRPAAAVVAVVAFLCLPRPAVGQIAAVTDLSGPDVQRFQPAIHSFGLLRVESAKITTIPEHGPPLNAFLVFNHVVKPKSGIDKNRNNLPRLDSLGTLNLIGSYAVIDHLSFGLDLPLHLYRSGGKVPTDTNGDGTADVNKAVSGFTLGDMRLSLKGSVFPPHKRKVGLAFGLDVGIPTGGGDAYTDEPGAWVEPKVMLEDRGKNIRVLYNASYRRRLSDMGTSRNIRYQNEMRHMLGIGVLFDDETDALELSLEFAFATSLDRPFDEATNYLEALAGLKYTAPSGFMVAGGAGVGGQINGLEGYGEPDFRMVATVGYQGEKYLPEDTDGDGILDDDDKCPIDPEDQDGFEDYDGCPDLDNDRDGVLDLVDECPNQPEDPDGVNDEDGCPDVDTDGDGLDDPIDQCPDQPEDKDGYLDEDGCPEDDNDRDGIADVQDTCPNDPEDVDQIQDQDGCPETDADADGIEDPHDACPEEPENINGCEDTDGCPEAKRVCVTEDKIVISDKIFFATNRARILKKSHDLLDEIAQVLLNHPEIELIEIQGHTDSKGRDRYNMRLSEKRAKAVYKHLAKLGVPKDRMQHKGYGEERPIADNDTDEGRAQNRRVEFHILKQRPTQR